MRLRNGSSPQISKRSSSGAVNMYRCRGRPAMLRVVLFPRAEATQIIRGYKPSLNVERLSADRLAVRIGRDLVAPCLGLPQQFLAAPFQGLAALVNGNRFLQRHLARLQPRDDRFEFFDRALEAQLLDVHFGVDLFGID